MKGKTYFHKPVTILIKLNFWLSCDLEKVNALNIVRWDESNKNGLQTFKRGVWCFLTCKTVKIMSKNGCLLEQTFSRWYLKGWNIIFWIKSEQYNKLQKLTNTEWIHRLVSTLMTLWNFELWNKDQMVPKGIPKYEIWLT